MDHVTKVVLDSIAALGFVVDVSEPTPGRHVVKAVDKATRETFVVRGDDLYDVACELAGQVGVELEDG